MSKETKVIDDNLWETLSFTRAAQRKIAEVQNILTHLSGYFETSVPFLAEKAVLGNDVAIATAPFKTFLNTILSYVGEEASNVKLTADADLDGDIEIDYIETEYDINQVTVSNNYNSINQETVERYIKGIEQVEKHITFLLGNVPKNKLQPTLPNYKALQPIAAKLYRNLMRFLLDKDTGMFRALVWYAEYIKLGIIPTDWMAPFKTLTNTIETTLADYVQDKVIVSSTNTECITKNTLDVLIGIPGTPDIPGIPGIYERLELRVTEAYDFLVLANGGTITPPPVEIPTVGSLTGDTAASTTDGAGTFSITVDYGTTDGTTPATGSVSTDNTNWTCTDTVCTATTGATTGNVVVTATSSNGLAIPTLTVAITNTDTPVDSSTPATLTADTTMTATNGIGAISYTLTEGLLADGTTPSTTTIALTSSGSATGTCDAGSCSVTGAVDGETLTLTANTDTPKGVTGSPAEVTVSNTILFPVENIQINGDSSATITGTAGAATGTYTINVTDGGQDASGEIISATYNPTAIVATTGTGTMTLGTKNINTTTGVGTVTYDITNATVGDVFTLNKEDIVSATLGNGTTGTGSGVSVTITPNPIVITLA